MKPKENTTNPATNKRQKTQKPKSHFIPIADLPWEKRHVDPFIRMIWNAEIKCEPAASEKGQFIGWRTFADGSREMFKVRGH